MDRLVPTEAKHQDYLYAYAGRYCEVRGRLRSTKCAEFTLQLDRSTKMSVFGNIVSAIFGHGATSAAAGSAAAPGVPAAKGTPTVAGSAATGKPMAREQVDEMIE